MREIEKRTRQFIINAPDPLTRSYWMLRDAALFGAHPRFVERLEKIFQARLALEKLEDDKEKSKNDFPNF